MNSLIVSLKFSPGHLSHIFALQKALFSMGSNVDIFLDPEYRNLLSDLSDDVFFTVSALKNKYDTVFIQNPSKRNIAFVNHIKSTSNPRIVYIYHEPWDSFKSYLKEGIKQTVKALGAHFFSTKLLQKIDHVIVPSQYARELYLKIDAKHNPNVTVIPLLFCDEAVNMKIDTNRKQYFSYIGHAVKGHAFDLFVKYMKFCIQRKKTVKFLIATRTNITQVIKKNRWLKKALEEGQVVIKHGRPLTNPEINQCYLDSFCVWNVYRRSTQSGVLPKAFMFGTPVLASNVGSFLEYVQHRVNGEIITKIADFDEIEEKTRRILSKLEDYVSGARETFKKEFDYHANLDRLKRLLEGK